MTNERIDVLAVMARDAGDAHKHRCEQLKPEAVIRREQMSVDARAAVAELIEAVDGECFKSPRLVAALARVQGCAA